MVRQETDQDLPFKIRPIQLVMHNPNFFWVHPLDTSKSIQVLGGAGFLFSAFAGAGISLTYYKFNQATSVPATFYQNVFKTWGRLLFGLAIGGYVGYLRFGDRQRLHNAYTSYRLRRRYPGAINITEKDIWKHKGHKCHNHIYEFQ
ncbi:unnamed protein product [Moneuplotes crassus]|uniref:Uncharacterized protein n=2 Tax=Euplotes crassus TaxID=5936 RepID=A0AAD1XNC4_EUPCR|nr:unnamed protein product [Moneuplotes crassus]